MVAVRWARGTFLIFMNYCFRYGPFMITVVYSAVITYWIHFIHVLHDSGPTCYVSAIVLGTATFFKNFLLCIGVSWINNAVRVSDEQQRDSAILPKPSLPSKLPHIIKQSSMCDTVGPCWLSVLNIAVWT